MRKGYKYLVGFLRTFVFPAFPPPPQQNPPGVVEKTPVHCHSAQPSRP